MASPARLLLLLMATVLAAKPGTKLSTVVVSLRDPSGTPIPGAHIKLFPSPDRTGAARGDGTYSFAVKPGNHAVFVSFRGFHDVAKRIDVQSEPMVVNLTLQIVSDCLCGPCITIQHPVPIELGIVDECRWLGLQSADLKKLPRQAVIFKNPAAHARERYAGFSLADALERFCGPHDCGPELSKSTSTFVVASSKDGSLVFPLAKLIDRASGNTLVVADELGGRPIPEGNLIIFLIEKKRVKESLAGVGLLRLASPQ